MRTMTLMAALAMVAATHSIATRTAVASDTTVTTAQAIHTFDLPTVRVYATVERDAVGLDGTVAMQETRIHDLPPVRVHAVRDERDVANVRTTAIAMRPAAVRRASLAIPRGSSRRGLTPQRGTSSRAEVRFDRWTALTCVIRLRLTRVWPMQPCNGGGQRSRATSGSRATGAMSLAERRR